MQGQWPKKISGLTPALGCSLVDTSRGGTIRGDLSYDGGEGRVRWCHREGAMKDV